LNGAPILLRTKMVVASTTSMRQFQLESFHGRFNNRLFQECQTNFGVSNSETSERRYFRVHANRLFRL